jgi:pimeloyl-ACP methyl ester carboxylesterase
MGLREIWFEREGTRLFAVEDGEGRPIVMLHGGMASHVASLPLVAPLKSRYRVLMPDVRGNGKSWYAGTLTFDQFADDVEALLDHIGADRAVVGGVSGGSGVALRFALRHPSRTAALVLVKPVYAGEDRGYTDQQKQTFTMMDAIASRALDEGVQVLRPMYANLPPEIREKALAMIESFDVASVVTTSRFIASGVQPFNSAENLKSLSMPTLLIRGDDALHPPEISDLYAENIPNGSIAPAPTADVASEIGACCVSIVFFPLTPPPRPFQAPGPWPRCPRRARSG